jgi:hypothetical protein
MQWENLSTTKLMKAREETGGVCIVPIGCMEKHGTHMPAGTDIFTVRRTVIDAVKIEPAVLFPFMPLRFGMGRACGYRPASCRHWQEGCSSLRNWQVRWWQSATDFQQEDTFQREDTRK